MVTTEHSQKSDKDFQSNLLNNKFSFLGRDVYFSKPDVTKLQFS